MSEAVSRPIRRLLIANRGEIALRIIATARRMGLETVAVYSDADQDAAHVAAADQAWRLGPAPARESYLMSPAILAAAAASGADAVHPGYGFLAENAAFAEACVTAGLIFIGPTAAMIRAMGSKSAAKTLMQAADVPVVPGYHGADQSAAALRQAADRIGYPLLIKASAGGGGKGMKVVEQAAGWDQALASAQREAASAFGDPTVLLEKYLTRPRHIEVQIFADQAGQRVHLFDRDCSLQRRYQKVVEEAPAPDLSPALRQALARTALAAAAAVDYQGAGTVEFILQDQQFYFMEMNTRLQVEHGVTEAITGLDLVEWQIRVARGEPLPLAQDQIRCRGHAVEARLYAEDATRDFLPQTGRLTHLRWPDDLRVDSAVRAGDSVSRHYDPMLAKLIAWGEDRDTALGRLGRGLAATEIVGVTTNRAFLQALLAHPEFVARAPDTGFIPRHAAELQVAPIADRRLLALAVLALLRQGERRQRRAADTADPHSPWGQATGWRLSGAAQVVLRLNDEPVAVTYAADGYDLALAPGSCFIAGDCAADGTLSARFEGETLSGRAIFGDARLTLFCQGRQAEFQLADPLAPRDQADPGGGLVAPMPGQVTRLFVAIGDQVDKGAPLMVLEAMKMEHTILAPHRGRVVELAFAVGDSVPERAVLARLESQAAVTAAAASP